MDLVSLGLGAAAGAAGSWAAKHLKERSSEPASVADLLLWAYLIDEGTVLLKDGGLLSGWRYRGPDVSSATGGEVRALSRQINSALRPLGSGWMLHVDAIRRPARQYAARKRCHFPSAGLRFLDDTRRAHYTGGRSHFETAYYVCATYLPPKEIYSRLGAFFIEGRPGGSGVDWELLLGRYRDDTRALEERLSSQLRMERLSSEALAAHLHECLTGLSHPVQLPSDGNPYLLSILSGKDLVGGFAPRIGGQHIRPVAVQGFPHATAPAQMDFLNRLPFPFRWSTRFIPYSRAAAQKQLSRREQKWFRKREGIRSLFTASSGENADAQADEQAARDRDALEMIEDLSEARAALSAGEAAFGHYTSTVIAASEDAKRADAAAREIVAGLTNEGFPARVEQVNALETFLGTLPGHGSYNVRRPILSTRNLADLMPTTAVWPGLKENPSDLIEGAPALMWGRTEGSTPFRVNLHDSDVGHSFCVGATGAGKSVLVGSLASQWMRYRGAQVYIFDVGYSHYLMHLLAGGEHYDLAGGSGDPVRLQPLRRVDRPSARLWVTDWLEILFDLQGRPLSAEQSETLTRAVRELARSERPSERTMLKLKTLLSEDRALQSVIEQYTAAGPYGALLDAETDTIEDGGFQVFEIEHLIGKGTKIVVPVLLYLFRRIEEQLSASRPTLIVIEEAWAALMESLFADRIKQWLLTLRKKNAAVFMVAHSVSQLRDPDIRNVELLVESCPTRFFLPNPDAQAPESRRAYRAFGLNEREIDRLAGARKKKDYYFSSPRGARMFQLGLAPEELAFMGTGPGLSMEETIREARHLQRTEGERWAAAWLRRCELEEAASRYESALKGSTSEEATPANAAAPVRVSMPSPVEKHPASANA